MHLDRTELEVRRWLRDASGLDPTVTEALLAKGSRPRSMKLVDALLVILRGVNLNPGEAPVDMVSIRMFIEAERIISVRRLHMMAVDDIRVSLADGTGPKDAGEFLTAIADRLTERASPKLAELKAGLDRLEADIAANTGTARRDRLAAIRRDAITLHRYITPQEQAMSDLQAMQVGWLTAANKMRLREIDDQLKRYVEDLDADREQATVMHDQIADRLAEQMNRNIYVLSMIAAIFLPLEFLTGLLGVNVGGIPGQGNPWGFVLVVVGLAGLAMLILLTFRRLGWLDQIWPRR